MKKLFKFVLITISALFILAIVAAIAASLLINPNDYKNDIVSAVKKETGRNLELEGDIKLSVFPWLGLELGKTRLGNAPGFGSKPMVSIDKVEVKLQLLPLLRKEIEVKTIVLEGLQLNLAKNKQGINNWDDLTRTTPATKTEIKKIQPVADKPAAATPAAVLTIGGVDIRRAQVHWVDASTGNSIHVRNLSLQTSKLESAKPLDFKLGFDLETGKPIIRTPVSLQGEITIDLDRQTLNVRQLELSLLDLEVVINLNGKNIIRSPSISGHVTLKPANLRNILKQLGMPVDMQAGALESVSLDTDFSYHQKTNLVSVNKLKLHLDDSKLTGKASVRMGSEPIIRTTIAVDKIDVDRYLPVATQPTKTGGSHPKGKTKKPAPLAIPIEPLRTLNLKGSFSLGSLKAMGIRSQKIFIPINASKGVITIGPSRAQMYGGKYRGKEILDVRKGALRISMDEKLSNVKIGALLKDADIFDKFTGVGNASGKLTARGLDQDDILNTLTGKVNISMKNGRIKGVNLHKMVNDARDLYSKAKGKPVQSRPKVTDEMEYGHLTASAKIKNGLVSNKDLKMTGPFIKVTGKGTVNLPRARMDYRVQVKIAANKSDPPVPVRIHGPFSNLGFNIEWNKILKDRARKEINKRIEQEKKKIEKNIQKQLGDELRKLFKR